MPESVSKTVTETASKVNTNMVKIALPDYEELVRKAARPVVNNVTWLQKTAEQSAMDSYAFGGFFAGIGAVMLIGGLLVAYSGKKKLSK